MLKNDHQEGGGCLGDSKILSDCEARHAIRVMQEVSKHEAIKIKLFKI